MESKRQLPTLVELTSVDNIEKMFKTDKFNLLVNQEPPQKLIKQNKFANNSNYLPIGTIEVMLQKMFGIFKIEVLRESQMFNAVCVTIRFHYQHPIDGQWYFHDGVGACQIQTKKGSSPAEMQDINNGAVMMALPIAKSYAIKDAVDHIGKLFGRDLNRVDVMEFKVNESVAEKVNEKERKNMEIYINNCITIEELEGLSFQADELDLSEIWKEKYNKLQKNGKDTI